MYASCKWDFLENDTFDYVADNLNNNNSDQRPFDFKYFTETEFNQKFFNIKNSNVFSVFHLNVRSLNSNCRNLCQFFSLN